MDLYDKVESLTKKDLLLLGAFVAEEHYEIFISGLLKNYKKNLMSLLEKK